MSQHDTVPPGDPHLRPGGATDETVEAVGRLTEALEWAERARGRLYDFHQLIGRADRLLGEALDALEGAGHGEIAGRLREDMLGRNVLPGRWTFQVVEEFDSGYWSPFREAEGQVRAALLEGRPHVFESELKEQRRTRGHPHHRARP